MTRRRSLGLSFLSTMLLSVAWGQEPHPDGFYLTSPLTLSSGYDDGFIANSTKYTDIVTLLTGPTFDWIRTTHRTTFTVDYQPEVEIFTSYPGFNAWNHAADLRLTHQINSRWSLDLGDAFYSTMDSTRKLVNSLILLPRGRFDQNASYIALVYHINGATKLTFRVDDAFTTVAIPVVAGRLDNVTNAGTVTLDRNLTSHQQISASYAFVHVSPLSSYSPTSVSFAALGYSYTFNPNFLFRVTAGSIAGSETAFNGSATLEKRLGGVWLAAGYQRYLGFFTGLTPVGGTTGSEPVFANGITPNDVYEVVSVRASGQITKRLGIKAAGQKAVNGVALNGQGIHSMMGQVQLNFQMTKQLALFARVDHYGQNINPFFNQSLSRNRYFGGLEITLGRQPETDNRHGKIPQDSTVIVPPVDQPLNEKEEK